MTKPTGGEFLWMPIDIETAPMEAYAWQPKVEYIGHEMVEQCTTVICASFRHPKTKQIQTLAVSPKSVKTVRNDREVCNNIHRLLTYCGENNVVIVSQNGDRFDLPKLRARFIFYRFKPLPPLITVDTLKQARAIGGFDYKRLDFLDKFLHGQGKVETRGWPMWRDIVSTHSTESKRRKALKEMIGYCEGDILALERVYETLKPYMKNHPNVNLWKRTYDHCPSCGENGLRYATKPHFNKTRVYRRMSCKYCGKWCKEYMSLKDWTAQPPKKQGMVA